MTDRKPLTKDEVLALKPHDSVWIETNFGYGNCWCEIDTIYDWHVWVVFDGKLVHFSMDNYDDTRFFTAWRLWADEPDEESRWSE